VLKHRQPDSGRPLRQGMKGVEMKQISIVCGSRDAKNVLEGLSAIPAHGQRLNLGTVSPDLLNLP